MSLDKFVLRGFTASTGGGCDGWVQKTAQPYVQQTVRESQNTGTSFVMGGGGTRSAGSSNKQSREAMPSSSIIDSRHGGTRGKGPVPRQCLGGGGAAKASPYSATLIPAAFFILSFLGAAYILINSMGLVPNPNRSLEHETSDADVYRRRQPQWAR